MKTDNYIIVASDHNTTLAKIVNDLNDLTDYNTITVDSISLLTQLLVSITPQLVIFSFKNNNFEIRQLLKSNFKISSTVLCLVKKYEQLPIISKEFSMIIQPLENEYLLNNVKSILSIKSIPTHIKIVKPKESIGVFENKNLARYVLELDQKKALLKKIRLRIKELSASVDLDTRRILNSIINNIKLDASGTHWDDFKMYFEGINPGFINELTSRFPFLTTKDIKYCCYLKMNMSNEDIRNLLGINKESVRTHKYRLKKKMILEKEQDLKSFISSF